MKKELVISSYTEDLLWINEIDSSVKLYVYNKDNRPNTINLPNIGREAHTYLYHICNNYNNLSDYIFFLQGRPFDHTGDCINIVNGIEHYWNEKSQLRYDGYWGYAHNFLGTMWTLTPSTQFSGECLPCRYDGYPHCSSFPNGMLPISDIWDEIFEINIPHTLEFVPGCQFHVHKKLIHNRSLNFWNKLYEMSISHEFFPWIFERIAPYVFDNNFKTKL
jgi:hypothetical protein